MPKADILAILEYFQSILNYVIVNTISFSVDSNTIMNSTSASAEMLEIATFL